MEIGTKTITREITQMKFKEVGTSGVFIAHTEANQKSSMAILQQNGFRAMSYQEALVKVDQNSELKEQLKGNWFYLEGKGSALSGLYYTFNEKGELIQGKGDIEKTVYVYTGSQPLSLGVLADSDARVCDRRFFSSNNPSHFARVVVGVRIGHEVTTPKIEVSEAEKPEEITLSGTNIDSFKALHRSAEEELSKLTEAFIEYFRIDKY